MKKITFLILFLGFLGNIQAQTLTRRQQRKLAKWEEKQMWHSNKACEYLEELKAEIKRVPNFEKEYVPMNLLGVPNVYGIQEEWVAHLIQEYKRHLKKANEYQFKIEDLTIGHIQSSVETTEAF